MMLRATSNALSARKLLVVGAGSRLRPTQSCIPNLIIYCRHPADFQIATITRSSTNMKYKNPKERVTCPPPEPPPPPPPKDDSLLWGTLALLAIAGGFVVYAKGSPEVRDWLTLNASWFDDIIAIVYEENMTYKEFAEACIEDTKKYIAYLRGENKPKKCSIEGGPVDDAPKAPKETSKCSGEEIAPCKKEPPPVVTRSICDIERCLVDLGACAINNYNTAKEACACYNELVDSTMATFTYKGMKALRLEMDQRIELVKTSLCNAANCINKLDEMVRYMDCGVDATKEQIFNTKRMHKDLHVKFKAAFIAFQWENDKSIVLDKEWQMVEELVDKYAFENESMFPGLKYISSKPHVTGDLDFVFYNCYRYVQHLKEQLKDYSDGMTERVNRAMDDLPQGDAAKGRDARLQKVLAAKRAESEKDYKTRLDQQKTRNEKFLKDNLKKLQEKHETTMATQLGQMEQEIRKKFNKMVAEKVASEKKIMAAELQEMSMKLKVVEDKLNARLKAERETRRSQELWAAGASLLAATKKGDPYVKVDRELKAIEKASGDDDKLVLTVLKSIPPSVREKGIVPESVLRESFRTMEKTARSVALVEQEGAPMPVYMLSWLQGLLLFMKMTGIPQREFEKPPMEPPEYLDTFDLLQRARFWIERGNLAVAVRYVDSLKGASRAAASRWYEAARTHLEVRQAAEAVLAHAAAMGLRYI